MATDKSLRQHYETVEVPKTKMVEGKRHNLAYITSKEAKLLQKTGAIKTKTPEGVFAYPGGAGTPGGYGGGPGTGGGNGSADRGGQAQKAAAEKAQKAARDARDTAREKAIEVAARTVKTKAPTRSPHKDTPTQKKEQLAIDLSNFGFEDTRAKPKVPTAPKKAAGPFDYLQGPKPKTETTTVHGKDDQVFTITKPKKYSPTYYQDRSKIGGETWGERAEQGLKRGFFDSGIGKFIKTALPFAIPALLPTKLVTPYKMAKLGYDVKQNKGLVGQAINQALTSNLASKIGSNISTSNIGDVFSGKRSTTDTTDTRDVRDRGDGRQVIAAPKDVVTAGVEKFTQPQFTQPQLTELQKRRAMLQGYADKGALNERGQKTLLQMNQLLEKYLVSVAHGGFIDKPLMGRSRDI